MAAPTGTLTLKDASGKTLAKTDARSFWEIFKSDMQTRINEALHDRVLATDTQNNVSYTGYVETEELVQLTSATVQIPASFAGLESVSVPTRIREQLFEITEVVETEDYVEITALHIFYRLRQINTLWEPSETTKYSGAAACRNIMTNALCDIGFKVASDSKDQLLGDELDVSRRNIVEAFLDPESGICKKYHLSLIRDNDVFYCLKEVGYDRGFLIQNKKNLLGVERDINIENIVTRVAPVGLDEDSNYVWLDYNGKKYIDSSHVAEYATPRTEILYTGIQIGRDGVTTQNIQEKLLEAAQKRFSEDEADIPQVTMTIQFLSLGDTEEYAQYRNLDKVYLYDILLVNDTIRDYSYSAQVIGVEHDILTGRLNSVTIGNLVETDGSRKIGAWQVPEITGWKIRNGTIGTAALDPNFGNNLRTEFYDALSSSTNGLRSEFNEALSGTANGIRHEFNDAANGLRSELEFTASHLWVAFWDDNNQLRSQLEMTASQLRTEFHNDMSDIHSSIQQEASQIRMEVHAASSALYSALTITESQIRGEVGDAVNGLYSSITEEASQIRAEVHNATSDLYSAITQTESQIRSEVANVSSGLYSSITQTASQIRSEVSNSISGVKSSITQTASQIRSEVSTAVNSVKSSITQTASQIRAEVSDSENRSKSSITQTASQIRSEVASGMSSLQSSITQEANRISLVVEGTGSNAKIRAAEITVAINNSSGTSEAKINADHVYIGNTKSTTVISGKVNASDITAAYIKSLVEEANVLTVGALTATNFHATDGAINSVNLHSLVYGLDLTQSGNTYTLAWTTVGGTANSKSFSRATSLSGTWSGGALSITASPQGNTASVNIGGFGSWGSGANANKYTYSITDSGTWGGGGQYSIKDVVIDASGRYSAGYSSAWSNTSVSASAQHNTGSSYTIIGTATLDGTNKTGTATLNATEAYDAGAASVTVTDLSLWDGDTQLSGDVNIGVAGSKTIQAWCKRAGTWVSGASITVRGPYLPDTGSWSYDYYQGKFQPKVTILGKTYYSTYLYTGLA